jgi:hypothetical protein
MDTPTSSGKEDLATTVGRFIGISLIAVVVSLCSSFALSVAWNNGPARLLSQPDLTWAESLACLITIWIVSSPLRLLRVKSVD